VNAGEKRLWHTDTMECVMVSCCTGAELQLRRVHGAPANGDPEILIRELYPTKSDLYERAAMLRHEYADADPA
jgi:hypothetical protein